MALSRRKRLRIVPIWIAAPILTLTQFSPTLPCDIIFSRLRREKAGISMKQVVRERECIHRDEGVEGEFYNGAFYVQALQRLPVNRAMVVAGKVSSFFWSDAPNILVWLCPACASELNLVDSPRAISQPARRQA
jgi:hypothetical protein